MATFALNDFAHSAGQDDYASITAYATTSRWGAVVSTDASWGSGSLSIGQTGTATSQWANGYTTAVTVMRTSASGVQLSHAQLSFHGQLVWQFDGTIALDAAQLDFDLQDSRIFGGNDVIAGNQFPNTLQGWGGNDTIDGHGGTDTVFFAGSYASYSIQRDSTGFTVAGPDGTDQLIDVERLRFSDGAYAYDIDGTAGQAYRLYKAAFDRAPDFGGLGYQMHDLDVNYTLSQVAGNFIASPEFHAKYGEVDNTQFITLLYVNVLDREPDAGGLQWHLDELAHGYSRADVLTFFSESPENKANVLGVIQDGMFYIPI